MRIVHASMTEWEWVPSENRFVLLRFNDWCGVPSAPATGSGSGAAEEGASQGSGATASQASSIASRRGFLVAARSCTSTAA